MRTLSVGKWLRSTESGELEKARGITMVDGSMGEETFEAALAVLGDMAWCASRFGRDAYRLLAILTPPTPGQSAPNHASDLRLVHNSAAQLDDLPLDPFEARQDFGQ